MSSRHLQFNLHFFTFSGVPNLIQLTLSHRQTAPSSVKQFLTISAMLATWMASWMTSFRDECGRLSNCKKKNFFGKWRCVSCANPPTWNMTKVGGSRRQTGPKWRRWPARRKRQKPFSGGKQTTFISSCFFRVREKRKTFPDISNHLLKNVPKCFLSFWAAARMGLSRGSKARARFGAITTSSWSTWKGD